MSSSFAGLIVTGCALATLTLSASAQTLATGDSRNPGQPSAPATCQTLTATNSTSNRSNPPSSDDTSRIQSALNTCKGTGKAVVLAASGSNNAFYSEEITVSGEGLIVNSGVTLYGGKTYGSGSELVLIEGSGSSLFGPGTIDGRGDIASGSARLVQTSNASNLNISNITLSQALHPNLYIQGGSGITVWNVTIRTPANRSNADGIDIDSVSNVTVANSSVEAGDDGIAVKTNASAASNITVKNSKFYGTHGLSIGSQTFDGVTNVLFTGNYVYGNDLSGNASTDANAINIKTDPDCGGTVKQVTYTNTCITEAKHLIVMNTEYGSCSGTSGTPDFTDIVVNGVKSTSSLSGAYSLFEGYSTSYEINAYLAYISLDATSINSASQDAKIALDNSNITPTGSNVTTSTFTISGSVPSCSF